MRIMYRRLIVAGGDVPISAGQKIRNMMIVLVLTPAAPSLKPDTNIAINSNETHHSCVYRMLI